MVALYIGQSGQNGHFPGWAKIFFQIASVPTVIFARYLPSFCSCHFVAPFVILCYNRGKRFLISRSFSFCSARLQPCGILMPPKPSHGGVFSP